VRRALRFLLLGAGVLIIGAPISGLVTLALMPLWSWIERVHSIEAVGHSGPSDWCFELVYAVWVLSAFVVVVRYLRRRVEPTVL
jgi:hypothetical protein